MVQFNDYVVNPHEFMDRSNTLLLDKCRDSLGLINFFLTVSLANDRNDKFFLNTVSGFEIKDNVYYMSNSDKTNEMPEFIRMFVS